MAESIKSKVGEAGHKIVETAKTVGHKIAEGAEKATEWVKDKTHTGTGACDTAKMACASVTTKTTADIREHMEVIGSCGNKLGVVDHVEGGSIKLTKNDSPDGQHHLIPLGWVARVDEHVHLSKNCGEAKSEWQAA